MRVARPHLPASLVVLLAAALLPAAGASASSSSPSSSRPHLVYVLSDNLGWANVGYHFDSPEVVTPHIDALVQSGVELDRLYTYKFCSPSRSSLLTGRLPIHVNLHNLALQVPRAGIPVGMATIADKLKLAGYRTHAVGKWHCGLASPAQTPTGRGFDSWLGYFNGYNDYLHSWSEYTCPDDPSLERSVTYNDSAADSHKCTNASVVKRHLGSITDLWLNDHPAHGLNGSGFEEALFLERVLGIIAGHDPAAPLFLYYPMHLVHSPLCAPEGYLEKFAFIEGEDDNVDHDRQFVAAMVHYMDDVVGNVAQALKDAGLWNNTLFVWSSDNGAAVELNTGMKNSYPLRGGYYTNWEGGVRANGLVNGGLLPSHVRGSKLRGVSSYIHLCDFYATFCGLAGVDAADDGALDAVGSALPGVDSLDMWPLLSGANLTSPRVEIAFSPLRGLQPLPPPTRNHISRAGLGDLLDPMLISGEYKLLMGKVDQCWWQGPQYPNGSSTWDTYDTWINCTTATKKACLFNIITDPTEHVDLAETLPATVDSMIARMEEIQKTVYDPDRGEPEYNASCAQVVKNGGFYGPWQD